MAKALIVCLTVGLIWQFILVAILVGREQRTLRWSTIREALWLRSPRSPRSGRVGGRVWLILIPLIAAFAAEELISGGIPTPANRDMGSFLDSDVGRHFLSGNWGWFGLIVVLLLFNTVLGEELLRLPDALAHRRLAEPERGVRPAPRAWSSSSSRSDTPAMRSHARPHRGSAR